MSPAAHIAIAAVISLVATTLAAIAARWLNHIDTEGDNWPGAPDQFADTQPLSAPVECDGGAV